MSFTYTQLKTAIQDYTDNTETTFVNNLDNFIKACEEKILKSVDLEFFRKNVTSTLTSSDKLEIDGDKNIMIINVQNIIKVCRSTLIIGFKS